MEFIKQKITIAGDIVEYDVFEQPVKVGTDYHRKHKPPVGDPITPIEEREAISANRAKAAVRRLVNSNAGKWLKPDETPYLPIFITLTFEDDIRDLNIANDIFTAAMQRLNYFVGGTKKHFLMYVAVTEFQDKTRGGVIHYHVLFFNLPFIEQVYDEIKRVWRHGNINVKSVRNVKDLGKYMVKYMTKNLKDGRLKGRKKYFASRGLKRWRVIYEKDLVDLMVEMLPETTKISTVSFDNKYCKKITRTTYNVKDDPAALAWYYNLVLNTPD